MRSWPAPYLPPVDSRIKHPRLKLRDSYSNELRELTDDEISMYVCGITPYDATHLGHAATYITFDLIHRYLLASKVHVSFAENITDIDDPLFERAKRDGVDWQTLATSQINLFTSDMSELRVIPPIAYSGVVESMPMIIEAIEGLIAHGVTYAIDDDIYLDLSKHPTALSNLPCELNEAISIFAERGGDPARSGKRHPLDPLLWKGESPDEPSWQASFGAGRPGWHIECVAIALATLPRARKTSISIQGGGSDLRFPHHYMTGVQASALTGVPFAAFYLHCGMIGLDGEKMSKSRGNLVFVSKLLEAGHHPNAIRFALLSRHYRDDLMWNDQLLADSEDFLQRLTNALSRIEVAPTTPVIEIIISALADDLDTPSVVSALSTWVDSTESGGNGGEAGELARALDLYLGLAL